MKEQNDDEKVKMFGADVLIKDMSRFYAYLESVWSTKRGRHSGRISMAGGPLDNDGNAKNLREVALCRNGASSVLFGL